MEHYHISAGKMQWVKSIDISVDPEQDEVQIVDSSDSSNRITISLSDWNELIEQIKTGKIDKISR